MSPTPTHPTYEPKLASVAAIIADATRALEVTPLGRKHLAGLLPSVIGL